MDYHRTNISRVDDIHYQSVTIIKIDLLMNRTRYEEMLKTVVKKGSYHDSVVLMLLTNKISAIEGVNKVFIMMATPGKQRYF